MPLIRYGTSSYERAEGDMPELPVLNMYAEAAPTEEEGIMLQSRPALDDRSADMGSGPVAALFKRDGVLSNTLIGVSGGNIYSGVTSLGSLAGTGPVSIAGNELGVMVAAGSTLRYYNGTTLADVTFPDTASVAQVFAGGSRFWAVRADTGKIYWTDPLEADVEALDFATAESLPDKLLQGLWIDGMAILFGSETIEFWQQTGSSTLPITPLVNMVVERGIKATGCAVALGETFAAVTNENEVIVSAAANVVSNPGLQARIGASTNVRLFTFFIDGVELLALRLDSETQVYNPKTGMWNEFGTYGLTNWAVQCYAGGVFGSATDGKTMTWGTDHTEANATGGIFERRIRFGFPMNSGGLNVNNLGFRVNPGNTPYLAGDYADPVMEVRLSRDAGKTWGEWHSASLGAQGEYRTKVQFRGLGMASQPAFFGEMRVTDPVPLRVSGVFINEPWGGR